MSEVPLRKNNFFGALKTSVTTKLVALLVANKIGVHTPKGTPSISVSRILLEGQIKIWEPIPWGYPGMRYLDPIRSI